MTDLPPNVIPFPRPYRQPPVRRQSPRQQAKPAPQERLNRMNPYYEEWINLIEVVKSGAIAKS